MQGLTKSKHFALTICASAILSACASSAHKSEKQGYFGTSNPFAKEAVYFVMTDRFVDGDPSNNHEDQGGAYPTWQLPLEGPDGNKAYVGYMGGDLKGVLNNADYIKDLGFTAVWLTPLVDNPDQAFSGDEPITYGGAFKDGGKTGYHGYWAKNFFTVDEHYVSEDLSVKQFSQQMKQKGFKLVFDIVANHGSPSFSMPTPQPEFGKLYDKAGNLIADHQNLAPEELSPSTNPLHAFFHNYPDIMKLSNLKDDSPLVRQYLLSSYKHWIEQGADAFRIDTIKHVPHGFWRYISDNLRAEYPDFFMFGESFAYDANQIAQHTLAKNGGISVLDFPMQKAMVEVFENPESSDFSALEDVLYLQHGPYANPYELTTFYDNHDMARINASDEGFIDANNWLFTVRGIPVIYQGSEVGFMRGKAEHAGNRNYFGQDNINKASDSAIYNELRNIANVRKMTPALQSGLQVNVELRGHKAAFYRVLQNESVSQTALVLLNKGDLAADFAVEKYMQPGLWTEKMSGRKVNVGDNTPLSATVSPHGVQVWVREGEINAPSLETRLKELMSTQ